MKRLALLSAAALLAGGAALGSVIAPAHVLPAVAEAPQATATATPTPTPTETFTGIAVGPDTPSPAPVIPQAGSPAKGAPLEAPAPAPEPSPAPEPVPAEIQEDDPAWQCLTHGNKVCGGNPVERVEAWGKFTTSALPASTLANAFSVTYRGTAMPGIDFPPSNYVTIPSHVTPNRVHVFQIEGGH